MRQTFSKRARRLDAALWAQVGRRMSKHTFVGAWVWQIGDDYKAMPSANRMLHAGELFRSVRSAAAMRVRPSSLQSRIVRGGAILTDHDGLRTRTLILSGAWSLALTLPTAKKTPALQNLTSVD